MEGSRLVRTPAGSHARCGAGQSHHCTSCAVDKHRAGDLPLWLPGGGLHRRTHVSTGWTAAACCWPLRLTWRPDVHARPGSAAANGNIPSPEQRTVSTTRLPTLLPTSTQGCAMNSAMKSRTRSTHLHQCAHWLVASAYPLVASSGKQGSDCAAAAGAAPEAMHLRALHYQNQVRYSSRSTYKSML